MYTCRFRIIVFVVQFVLTPSFGARAQTISANGSVAVVNEEVEFVPQLSQYLYLDYSSVTDNHWSMSGERNSDEE